MILLYKKYKILKELKCRKMSNTVRYLYMVSSPALAGSYKINLLDIFKDLGSKIFKRFEIYYLQRSCIVFSSPKAFENFKFMLEIISKLFKEYYKLMIILILGSRA